MNHDRLDDLTRTLATTTTRRSFLKTLAGGAAGALLASFGVGKVAAKDGQEVQGQEGVLQRPLCERHVFRLSIQPSLRPNLLWRWRNL